ncbi:unnamed protein product [Periconia digitata]|uniref:Carrier domain-containing protein n=1 Tax=Periconia digitata TaxID=1303443 RepID=A0A9W4UGL4_9PLEO|nr:unnamed protein product [Periconia digitata]
MNPIKNTSFTPTPVAICGISLRLPGGVTSPDEFWKLLLSKKDVGCKVPQNRYNVDGFYSSSGRPGHVRSNRGYFLEESTDIGVFDNSFFSMSSQAVAKLDPQARLLLQLTHECLESAGEAAPHGQNIGCYIGSFGKDWQDRFAHGTEPSGAHNVLGYGEFVLSNRISYEFDLRGPSLTIGTGCSSSLVALNQAIEALKVGACDGALIGGANLITGPGLTLDLDEAGVLSPTGSCRAFDADANGYVRGEAVNMIYVKHLDAALRDANPIRAVIRGSAINSDGKTDSFTTPNPKAQAKLIRQSYSHAGITAIEELQKTAFVECHGTGTVTGDPIEVSAVAEVFRSQNNGERLYIGSVKPSVGHSESASGLTSLIKAVLALENKTIPPNINFSKPNPSIPFSQFNLCVPVDALAWPKDRVERVSVNSFGLGGANAHVVLESYECFLNNMSQEELRRYIPNRRSVESVEPCSRCHLFVFSASHPKSLQRMIARHQEFASLKPEMIKDVAYTLGCRRRRFAHRAFSIINKQGEVLYTSPLLRVPGDSRKVAMVFTGQGSQYARMGIELYYINTVFASSMQRSENVLGALQDKPSWTIMGELSKCATDSQMKEAIISQTLGTAVQIALVDLLFSMDIQPTLVIGHSSGEIAAMYAAGRLTAEEAIINSYFRGATASAMAKPGAMAVVSIAWADVQPLLTSGVVVASENSPTSVTISGDADQIDLVLDAVRDAYPHAISKPLNINFAYHSPHMSKVAAEYKKKLNSIMDVDLKMNEDKKLPQRCQIFSSVTGRQLYREDPVDSKYWARNLESPVLFKKAIEEAIHSYRRQCFTTGRNATELFFLEVGPHSSLQAPLQQILNGLSYPSPYVSCLDRKQPSDEKLLSAVGSLYNGNVFVDFSRLTNSCGDSRVIPDLPTYPWHQNSQSTLYESTVYRDWRMRRYTKHELLGNRVLEITNNEAVWRNILSLEQIAWLGDHISRGNIVFPGTGYLSMAGEAVRQLCSEDGTKSFTGYSVRNVTIRTPLVISDSETEILTSLRRAQLTSQLESSWYEFVISSRKGTSWVRHCHGDVQCIAQLPTKSVLTESPSLTRNVDAKAWYRGYRRVGCFHGPSFQGLSQITCCPTGKWKSTSLAFQTCTSDEMFYSIHPTRIDCMLQLFIIARLRGLARHAESLAVPIFFGNVDVFTTSTEPIKMAVSAGCSLSGVISGDGTGVSENGNVALVMKGIRLGSLAREKTACQASLSLHGGARTVWRPHFDFVDAVDLIKSNPKQKDAMQKLEILQRVFVKEALQLVEGVHTDIPHLKRYCLWLAEQAKLYPYSAANLSKEIPSVSHTPYEPFGRALERVLDSITALFTGKIEPLEVLLPDNLLTEIYNCNTSDRSTLIELLGHMKPNMNILEIGAGTGGTTSIFLRHLKSPIGNNERLFRHYTFTDISGGFFPAARNRFQDHVENIEFRTLDISLDPSIQGFESGAYDLVIATNVLHATPDLHQTLINVRSLLKSDGYLYMEELCCENKAINSIMGILPGWWQDERIGGRFEEPYIKPSDWDRELKAANFQGGIRKLSLDAEQPYQLCAIIVSGPPYRTYDSDESSMLAKTPVTVFVDSIAEGHGYSMVDEEFSTQIVRGLRSNIEVRGRTTSLQTFPNDEKADLSETIDRSCHIVAFMDLQRAYFPDITSSSFENFKCLLEFAGIHGISILWVTRACQFRSIDPQWAQTIGAARTLRGELGVDMAVCEISEDDIKQSETGALVASIFERFQSERDLFANGKNSLSPEFEYIITQGEIHIGRLLPVDVDSELETLRKIGRANPDHYMRQQLHVGDYGKLDTIEWSSQAPNVQSLNSYQVDVKMVAVGVSFRDVMVALGIIDTEALSMGAEGTGIVRAIGSSVFHVAEGDRVFVLARQCFSTNTRVHADLCVKVPEDLDLKEAATMPCAFATTIHCLENVGNLRSGQTILIHSACGGVGLAAIQISRMIGATIFATVSSEEKVDHLVKNYGISRQHISHSRDTSFVTDIMRMTNGRGVDLVLNSLSGELLHASWRCTAEFGSMIEIGKRDFIDHGKLDLDIFELNRSYHGVDLGHLLERRPEYVRELLERMVSYLQEKKIGSISPVAFFQSTQVAQCFQEMRKGKHIGKMVVDMKDSGGGENAMAEDCALEKPSNLLFDSGSSYVLAGGLGGLGIEIARWMADNGAGRLIFLSRSADLGSERHTQFLKELESQGCSAEVVAGSVSTIADVERAVHIAESNGKMPLRGMMNLSMVLRDQGFPKMSHADWTEVAEPKIRGTWNLHHASLDKSLDFFIMFSSTSGILGLRGQANYAGASTFLDAFVQYRHSMKLPAASVDIGVMLDHGAVADDKQNLQYLLAGGGYGIYTAELIDAVEYLIRTPLPSTHVQENLATLSAWSEPSQLAIGIRSTIPLDSPDNRQVWKKDRRMAIYYNMLASSSQSSAASTMTSRSLPSPSLANFLIEYSAKPDSFPEKDAAACFAKIIACRVSDLLLHPTSEDKITETVLNQSLVDFGLDSLVAIEMRSWFQSSFGFDINVLEMLATGSLHSLGGLAATRFAAKNRASFKKA